MKRSLLNIISRILIIAGCALILAAGIYEGVNYPWKLVFGGDLQEDTMPDPTTPSPEGSEEIEIVLDWNEIVPESTCGDNDDEDIPLPGSDTIISAADKPAAPQNSAPSRKYLHLGVFKIPKLNVSVNLYEGSDEQMRKGVGHVPGTEFPGEAGNSVIGGHRNYIYMHPFRHLDKMTSGDRIIIKSNGGDVYTYTVYEVFEVEPTDTWVLKNVEGRKYVLTLITCTPVMNPVKRLIVRAELTDVNGNGPPPEDTPETPVPPETPSTSPSPSDSPSGLPSESPDTGEQKETDVSPEETAPDGENLPEPEETGSSDDAEPPNEAPPEPSAE